MFKLKHVITEERGLWSSGVETSCRRSSVLARSSGIRKKLTEKSKPSLIFLKVKSKVRKSKFKPRAVTKFSGAELSVEEVSKAAKS